MSSARITGTGSYLPERILTNEELSTIVDTSDEWIRERSGIAQRHIAADGETTLDLAEHASRRALEAAGRTAGDIDLIVIATTTPDQIFPSTACLLQHRLGNVGAAAFDVQAVCSGFVYALSVADNFIKAGSSRCALVIGAETFSRILNWEDRSTCVLFGDGAGAVVMEASDEPGVMSTHLHADGAHASALHVPAGVSQGYDAVQEGRAFVEMRGSEVFRHQANIRIIKATAKKLRMGMDKVIVTVDRHGNTSAASIPLALDEAVRTGQLQRGQLFLIEAFGGGFTWGSALIRY